MKRVKIFKSDKIKIRCKAKYLKMNRTAIFKSKKIYVARLNLVRCRARNKHRVVIFKSWFSFCLDRPRSKALWWLQRHL